MPLPPRPFHTLSDIANRWSVVPIDIVGWASEGLLALSVAAPPVKTASSRILCDLVEIAGTDVLPLFRPDGAKLERVCIRRIRAHGETEWQWISEPAEGLMIVAPDVLITRAEVAALRAAARSARWRIDLRHQTGKSNRPPPIRRPWRASHGTIGTSSLSLSRAESMPTGCHRPRANWSAKCSIGSRRARTSTRPTRARSDARSRWSGGS